MIATEKTKIEKVTRQVTLTGLRPLMFDRYAGDNNTKLSWLQKIYLIPGTDQLAIPTANVMSFLSSHNTNSAPKRLRDKRKYKDICNACLSFITIDGCQEYPDYIPLERKGQRIHVGETTKEHEPKSGLWLHRSVARLDKGIPNPKERPVLDLPWSISFKFTLLGNREIKEQEIRNLIEEGGLAIGLGTYRGVYGKFVISQWQ